MKTIFIASEFSRYPAGRFKSDGPFSGEHFRELFLVPHLNDEESKIEINFDGARGYGSSFLEEAFGGLVRLGFNPNDILKKFIFVSSKDPSLIEEVKTYILQTNHDIYTE